MSDSLIWIIFIFAIINIFMVFFAIQKISRISGSNTEKNIREEFRQSREELNKDFRGLREEISTSQKGSLDSINKSVGELGKSQSQNLQSVEKRIQEMMISNETRIARIDETLDKKIGAMQESNEKKLEQMRQTVDEKLQSTLEKRLSESFKQVSTQLESVQKGLGEMKNLASDVGSLQKVLSNVKSRGTWGEVQLGSLLEEILTPDQFARNVKTVSGSDNTVEFAIKLPGRSSDKNDKVWLPVDAKFPQEDYQRLIDASEAGNVEDTKKAQESLLRSIRNSAKEISSKYVSPPDTTDFAIMFLPTEGLYAEVLRQPGMIEELQHNWRIVVSGPTTIAALLNSLQMGFRTLAIEKRSSEVWKTLSAVKTEFGKFGNVLEKVKKQLDTASKSIEETGTRSRAIERKLQGVEELPSSSDPLGIPIDSDLPFSEL